MEQKRKLAALKAANVNHVLQLNHQRNTLLRDCLNALAEYRIIHSDAECAGILAIANGSNTQQFPHAALPILDPEHSFAVVWDEAQLPIIECLGANLLAHWEDVMAVAFDTCLVDLEERRAILIRN